MVTTADPYRDSPFKLNTYLVESASRNGELEALYVWLFLKAADMARNGSSTGRIHDINWAVAELATRMGRTKRTIRRNLENAETAGYIHIDACADMVWIRSRARVTISKWRSDLDDHEVAAGNLPDKWVRHLNDVLEVSVRIDEVWDATSKAGSHSRLLDISRQRCTERGWCRATFARLVGMDRCSTARLDRKTEKRRGFQYAFVDVSDVTGKNDSATNDKLAADLISAYNQFSHSLDGRGKKLWTGKNSSGHTVIFTQTAVKWDTPFQGRLKFDEDVRKLASQTVSTSVLGECRSLHPVVEGEGLDADNRRGVDAISESLRQSIWKTIETLVNARGLTGLKIKPPIRTLSVATWSLPFATATPVTQSGDPDLKDQDLYENELFKNVS